MDCVVAYGGFDVLCCPIPIKRRDDSHRHVDMITAESLEGIINLHIISTTEQLKWGDYLPLLAELLHALKSSA